MSGLPSADVAVVGAGIVGAAIFHELADRGLKVTAVDAHRGGGGTTARCGGVVRAYHDDPVLSDRSLVGWRYFRSFAERTGVDVPFRSCGFLYLPALDRAQYAQAETARIAAAGAPAEWLPPHELTRRFGGLVRGDACGAVWEPDAGYIDADETVRGFLLAGQRKGGRLVEGVTVRGPVRQDGRITGVDTDSGVVRARSVVLATGAWTPSLLTSWGVPHDLWTQAIQVDLRLPAAPVAGHPAYMDDIHDLNGRPHPDAAGIYVGHPTGLRTPGAGHQPLDPQHSARIRAAAARRLRWAGDSRACGGLRAAECYAPDTRARVGPLVGDPALLLATGFSGGGFKMAPWAATEVLRHLTSTTP
ncbi:FAD-dependent oxidoreductase [Streptomyces sp. ICC4]|uniref:NAD(P)/FAD-dependent oxidoreductase n=1 Tax=Streptomyces sp. ICC4 TaxID=2099584 RepID=UPI000DC77F8E|nr:FAD-dependent oxidoreductase [Streptomyces sp. ICC4]AWZ06110.1 hypothetical protein DRB89_17440 [Streptomyces sp. ICC4]